MCYAARVQLAGHIARSTLTLGSPSATLALAVRLLRRPTSFAFVHKLPQDNQLQQAQPLHRSTTALAKLPPQGCARHEKYHQCQPLRRLTQSAPAPTAEDLRNAATHQPRNEVLWSPR